MEDFRDVLDECGFQDLRFSGNKFTWCNGHGKGHTVWERLDRAVSTVEWMDMFSASKVDHLESGSSDHKPLMIILAGIPKKINKPWRFEQMWMEEVGYRELMEDAWAYEFQGSAMNRLEGKVDRCHRNLIRWSKVAFGNVTQKLKKKKKLLALVEVEATRGGHIARVLRLNKEISKLLVKEEQMWKQQSRSLWLQEGDNNTRYFHSQASHGFRMNRIDNLDDANRDLCSDEDGISNILINYYQQLFTSSNPSMIEAIVEQIPCSINDEMNEELLADFTREEVVVALKQMEPLKAPGPDGLSLLFFQHYWHAVEDDVTEAVLSFLFTGVIPPSINRTFISLIPKVKGPTKVSEFRPISLCNIIYKFVSKVVANRIKGLLPLIISDTRSAFQSDKAISDNILVAFETFHHMKNQKSMKGGFMALKLDMSKAYDRVEWRFLELTIRKMGFCNWWVDLIMSCIGSASYQVLVNGVPIGHIRPKGGLGKTILYPHISF